MKPEDEKQEIEITPEMIEAGVRYCALNDVENVASLDIFVADLYRTMASLRSLRNPKRSE